MKTPFFYINKIQMIENNNLQNTDFEKKKMNRKNCIYSNKSNVPGAEIR